MCAVSVFVLSTRTRGSCVSTWAQGASACRRAPCMHAPAWDTPSECREVGVFMRDGAHSELSSACGRSHRCRQLQGPTACQSLQDAQGRQTPAHALIPWRESECSEPWKVLTSPDGVLMDVVELWPQDPSGSLLGIPTQGFSSSSSMGSKHESRVIGPLPPPTSGLLPGSGLLRDRPAVAAPGGPAPRGTSIERNLGAANAKGGTPLLAPTSCA